MHYRRPLEGVDDKLMCLGGEDEKEGLIGGFLDNFHGLDFELDLYFSDFVHRAIALLLFFYVEFQGNIFVFNDLLLVFSVNEELVDSYLPILKPDVGCLVFYF